MIDVKEEFKKIITAMTLNFPTYALLLRRLRVIYIDNDSFASVNEREIILGNKFFKVKHEEQFGVLAHEALHLILAHPERFSELIKKLHIKHHVLNIIADAKINSSLQQDVFQLPNPTLPSHIQQIFGISEDVVKKASLEEIALMLVKQQKQLSQQMQPMQVDVHIQPQQQRQQSSPSSSQKQKQQEQQKKENAQQQREKGDSKSQEKQQESKGKGNGQSQEQKKESDQNNQEGGKSDRDKEKGEKQSSSDVQQGQEKQQEQEESSSSQGQQNQDNQSQEIVLNEGDESLKKAKDKDKLKQIKQQIFLEVIFSAKAVGQCPAGLQRLLNELEKPKVHWKRLLRNALEKGLGNDVKKTWSRLNRKNPMLPMKELVGLRNAIVLVDTSGSIGEKQLKQMLAEIYGVLKTRRVKQITVIAWDAEIQSELVLKTPSDIQNVKAGLKGGGGTVITPAINRALKISKKGDIFIVLSDFYTTESAEELKKLFSSLRRKGKVILISVNGKKIKFPKCINVNISL